mmetsp:Transcript_67133/g.99391  ORF Transcript_67133/g.99391 Transcript_67133/m.99391 type:complete len:280 (-) Transcript_67133:1335-2174(-)
MVSTLSGVRPFFISFERHSATLDWTPSLGVRSASMSILIVESILSAFSSPFKWSATEPSATTAPSFLRSDAATSRGTLTLLREPRQLSSAFPVLRTASKCGMRKAIAASDEPCVAATSRAPFRAAPQTFSFPSLRPYAIRNAVNILMALISSVTLVDGSAREAITLRMPRRVDTFSSLSFSGSSVLDDPDLNWFSSISFVTVGALLGAFGIGFFMIFFLPADEPAKPAPARMDFFGFLVGKPVDIFFAVFFGATTGAIVLFLVWTLGSASLTTVGKASM